MIHPKKSPCFIEFSPVFCGFPEVLIGSQNERAVCDGFFWLEHRKEGGAIHHIAGFLGKPMIQADGQAILWQQTAVLRRFYAPLAPC